MRFNVKRDTHPPVDLPSLRLDVHPTRMDDEYHGMVSFTSQAILLNEDNGPDMQRSTLLHEIIHAGLQNIGVEDGHDEATINGLSNQLLYVIQNNPEWMEWLMDRDLPMPTAGDETEDEGEDDDPEDDPDPDPPDTESNVIALHPKEKEDKKDRAGQDSAPKARASAAKGGKRDKRTGRRRR